jgi:hypothetical protein
VATIVIAYDSRAAANHRHEEIVTVIPRMVGRIRSANREVQVATVELRHGETASNSNSDLTHQTEMMRHRRQRASQSFYDISHHLGYVLHQTSSSIIQLFSREWYDL